MIGKLWGRVDAVFEDSLILDVGGVGYLVHVSTKALDQISRSDDILCLFIETQVRPEMIKLFGFLRAEEQAWFRLLVEVQGVGARTALALLSTLSISDLANAVSFGDKASVARAPGIGPKVAQRIVTELKDKIPRTWVIGGESPGKQESGAAVGAPEHNSAMADARSALINLGYIETKATAAVMKAGAEAGGEASAELIIKLALKELAR